MNGIEITLRDYKPETDDAYIYSTWTRYAWYSPKEEIKIPKRRWFHLKTNEIRGILQEAKVRIACFKDDPYIIAGYVVARRGQVEWLCVKKDYHQQGIEDLLTRSIEEKHGK